MEVEIVPIAWINALLSACIHQRKLHLTCTLQGCLEKQRREKQEGKQEPAAVNRAAVSLRKCSHQLVTHHMDRVAVEQWAALFTQSTSVQYYSSVQHICKGLQCSGVKIYLRYVKGWNLNTCFFVYVLMIPYSRRHHDVVAVACMKAKKRDLHKTATENWFI